MTVPDPEHDMIMMIMMIVMIMIVMMIVMITIRYNRIDSMIVSSFDRPRPNTEDILNFFFNININIMPTNKDSSNVKSNIASKATSKASKASDTKAKAPTRKGPGRPRKIPKKESIPRVGCKDEPEDENNLIELLYDMPILLKKIFGFFKSLASTQIQFVFRKHEVIIYGQDHHDKSRIRVRIDTAKLNSYYCGEELDIGLNCKELELILNKIDKEYNTLVINISKRNKQKFIKLVLNTNIQIREIHNIDIIGQYNSISKHEDDFNRLNHTIEFTLPGKYFKKTIGDMRSFSKTLSIIQDEPNNPVRFEYISDNKKIRSSHVIRNNDKIKLVSKLDEDDSFRIDIMLQYIKPISSIYISETSKISIDENRPFMVTSHLDNGTIEIKTLTAIIDNR